MLASSFMKVILVASIALAAYLVSSALRHVHELGAVVVAVEGLVELAHAFLRAGGAGADDDAVGLEEVADGGAFLEEFRVGDDVEGDRLAAFGEDLLDLGLDLVGGADRDSALVLTIT